MRRVRLYDVCSGAGFYLLLCVTRELISGRVIVRALIRSVSASVRPPPSSLFIMLCFLASRRQQRCFGPSHPLDSVLYTALQAADYNPPP